MKRDVHLVEFALSGRSQGLDEAMRIRPLACVLLKGFAEQDPRIRKDYDIAVHTRDVREPLSDCVAPLLAGADPIVGFSCYTWNLDQIRRATRALKTAAPRATVIWGGPEVSFSAGEIMRGEPAVDIIVCGPGEMAFQRILLALANLDDLASIPCLAYRADGGIREVPGGFLRTDPGLVPSPFQNGLIDLASDRDHAVYLETLRGCPKACGYCLWGGGLTDLSYFPLERVLRDIEIIYSNPRVKNVYITDSFLFYCTNRAEIILEKIRQENAHGISTFVEIDPFELEPRHVPYLQPVCQSDYRLGVQTFTARALEAAGRPGNGRGKIAACVEMLRQADPRARISFALIYGLPKDSLEGFRRTISFALRLLPDSLKINVLAVLPGTDFWARRDELGLVFEEDPPHRLLRSPDFSEDDLDECRLLTTWVLYLMRSTTFKRVLFDLVRNHVIDEPIAFIDAVAERLGPDEPWIRDVSTLAGTSVEEENARRIVTIDRSEDTAGRLRLYRAILEILKARHASEHGRPIQQDVSHFEKTGKFMPSHGNEGWKR